MVAKFEEAIGYKFKNRKLRLAICRHKSVVPLETALERYDFDQESPALLGDRMLKNVINIKGESDIYTAFPSQMIQTNKFMYHYVWDMGWVDYLHIVPVFKNKKDMYHEYGTFFEAIGAGIYLEYGYKEFEKFALRYAYDMSPMVYMLGKTDLLYILKCLNKPEFCYFELSSLMKLVFGEKVKVNKLSETPYGVELVIKIPPFGRSKKEARKYVRSLKSLSLSVEEAAKKALSEIEEDYKKTYQQIRS